MKETLQDKQLLYTIYAQIKGYRMNLIHVHRLTISLFILLGLIIFNPANASIDNINDAVNKSGKQRMLTQRMLKDYALVGMNNTFGYPDKDLEKQISLFDKTLNDLNHFNKNNNIAQSIIKIKKLWSPIKTKLKQKPTLESAVDLQKSLDRLLESCNDLTILFVKASGKNNLEIISISGRQRMLSQRLSALYMLKVWGVNDSDFIHKLEKTMDEFSKAEKILENFSKNTAEIKDSLQRVKKLFMWFELMANSTSGRYIPSLISKSSDKINSEMNTVTKLYIQILK